MTLKIVEGFVPNFFTFVFERKEAGSTGAIIVAGFELDVGVVTRLGNFDIEF